MLLPTAGDGSGGGGGTSAPANPTETLSAALGFVTEFNANTQIFTNTALLLLATLFSLGTQLKGVNDRLTALEARVGNLDGRIGADNANINRRGGR